MPRTTHRAAPSPQPPAARPKPLSERERRFVEAFTGKAKGQKRKSALLSGYSEANAAPQASRLLKKANVQAVIAARTSTVMGPTEWLERVATIARFDVRKLFDSETDKLKPVSELGDDIAPCVAGVKVRRITSHRSKAGDAETDTEEDIIEVKSVDPLRALELIGKNLGLIRDRMEHEAAGSLLDTLERIAAAVPAVTP